MKKIELPSDLEEIYTKFGTAGETARYYGVGNTLMLQWLRQKDLPVRKRGDQKVKNYLHKNF